MLSGSNPMLQDLAEVRRYERQYSPESRPMPERVLPLVIEAGSSSDTEVPAQLLNLSLQPLLSRVYMAL
jgi:hypothetical protein